MWRTLLLRIGQRESLSVGLFFYLVIYIFFKENIIPLFFRKHSHRLVSKQLNIPDGKTYLWIL